MKPNSVKVSNGGIKLRPQRTFSEDLRRKIVQDISNRQITVTQASRLYGVATTNIYKWIYRYSPNLPKGVKQVVEMESESEKARKLEERLSELERAYGRKQLEIDFLERLINLASEELGIDLKKNFGTKPLSGSDPTRKNTPTS